MPPKTFSLEFVQALLDYEYRMEEGDDEAKSWFQQYFAALLADISRADEPTLISFVKDELGFVGSPALFVLEVYQDFLPHVYEKLERLMDQEKIEMDEN